MYVKKKYVLLKQTFQWEPNQSSGNFYVFKVNYCDYFLHMTAYIKY